MIEHKNEVLRMFTSGAWLLGGELLVHLESSWCATATVCKEGSAENVRVDTGAELSIQSGNEQGL